MAPRRWSTVGASANIIEASWQALADSVEYGLVVANDFQRDAGNSMSSKELRMKANIVLLPGDGIGPEVIQRGRRVLDAMAAHVRPSLSLSAEHLIGGCAIDRYGTALTDETLAACQAADAVLLGAVGGPKWDDPTASGAPGTGPTGLRKGLGVFANLRPVKVHPAPGRMLAAASPKNWPAWICSSCAS